MEEPVLAEKNASESIGNILPGVLNNLGLDKAFDEARLRKEWSRIVGEPMSSRCYPTKVREGVLYIAVENNVWMQEIRFLQKQIVKRIKESFPELEIKGIRIGLERESGRE